MWDLAIFIFFLCTRERFLPESQNDFDYDSMKKYIDEWLSEYKGNKKLSSRVAANHQKSLNKFRLLPFEVRELIISLIDYENSGMFRNWFEV